MIRKGASAAQMESMAEEDVFLGRLKLLIIMSKAYLKQYPLGLHRQQAIEDNAHFVFYHTLHHTSAKMNALSSTDNGELTKDTQRHLFYQRAQLLAVMARSFADGNPMGGYRRQALEDNIDSICESLAEQFPLADVEFLKVA